MSFPAFACQNWLIASWGAAALCGATAPGYPRRSPAVLAFPWPAAVCLADFSGSAFLPCRDSVVKVLWRFGTVAFRLPWPYDGTVAFHLSSLNFRFLRFAQKLLRSIVQVALLRSAALYGNIKPPTKGGIICRYRKTREKALTGTMRLAIISASGRRKTPGRKYGQRQSKRGKVYKAISCKRAGNGWSATGPPIWSGTAKQNRPEK